MPLLKKTNQIYTTQDPLSCREKLIQYKKQKWEHMNYKSCNNLTINIQTESMYIFLINYDQLNVQVDMEFHT